MSARLQNAIQAEEPTPFESDAPGPSTPADTSLVQTTEEEREGFLIVRGILREVVDPSRVVSRDVQSYFGVLLDDTNRKPICRLHLNGSKWYVEVFDVEGGEKLPLSDLGALYGVADRLKAAVARYEG